MYRSILLLALVGAAFAENEIVENELVEEVIFALPHDESTVIIVAENLLPAHPCDYETCEPDFVCELDQSALPAIKPLCRSLTEAIAEPGHTQLCLKTRRTDNVQVENPREEYTHQCQCMEQCPEPRTGEEVCGDDGHTYPSHCHLHREACKAYRAIRILHKGSCLPENDNCPILEVDAQQEDSAAYLSCKDPREICDAKWMVGPPKLLIPAQSTERYTVRPRPTGYGSSILITQVEPEDENRFKCACSDRPECPFQVARLHEPGHVEPEATCFDIVHSTHEHLLFDAESPEADFRHCQIHNVTAKDITWIDFKASNVHATNCSFETIRIVNSHITNLTLANFTQVRHIEVINSTVMNITFLNSTLLNMTFVNVTLLNHTFVNATAYNFTYINTTITNHTFLNSTIYNFTYINSTIFNKTINSTVFKNLTLINSTMVNVTMLNSTITNHTLVNVTAFNLTKWNVTINGSIYSNVTLNNTMWKNVTFLNNISIPLFNNLTNFTLYNATFYNVSLQSINATHFTFINST
eukprot:scpid73322/ scgid24511/ Follistatin-related protein 5; Follistatin-like protein 5; m-D/Bsp120I 1-2